MKSIVILLLATVGLASATTLEVVRIFQPLSLHGTDVDYDFEGEPVQARVLSKPMVLSGALPEGLVTAVAAPHQMPPVPNYGESECNLLCLYNLKMTGEMTGEAKLKVVIDLSHNKVPKDVEISLRTVLKLSISALKRTLNDYHSAENKPLKVSVEFAGLDRKTASLRDLAGKFQITGR